MHDIKGLLVDVVLHQGHMRGDIQRAFLAENDFVAQDIARRFFGGEQRVFKVLLVAGADVQFATQGLELLDAQFVLERFDVEMPAFVGAGDELRVLGKRLVPGKVVQRGIEQRDGATGGAARKIMHPPGRLHRGIQAQPGVLDIVIDAEAVLQRLLQQGFGKGGNILQITQCLIGGVLRGPAELDGFFQLAVSGG